MVMENNILSCVRSAFVAVTALFAVCGSAVEAVTYTVMVDGGTETSPVLLESLDVQIEKEGCVAETKRFLEVYGDFANGPAIFRKRGSGWMMSSVKMAQFTGEIRIEEGAFMVNTNLMTGALNPSTAPKVVVSNGASFVLAATPDTCPAAKGPYNSNDPGLHLCNHFYLTGSGVDNLGAIVNMLGDDQTYLFSGDWTLLGDVLLCGHSTFRYDLANAPTVNMNGHTLTVKKGTSGTWVFCVGSACFTEGHIVVDGAKIQPQGGTASSAWIGTPANMLILTNNATLSFYNTKVSIPWTLVCENGSVIACSGTSANNSDLAAGTNKYNYWNAPVVFNGATTVSGGSANKGFTVNGPISGKGTVTSECWMQLTRPSPDFKGKIKVVDSNSRKNSGLALYCGDAVAQADAITITDSDLRLMNNARYRLPNIEFRTRDANRTLQMPISGVAALGLNRPETGSTVTRFKKTGTKSLAVEGGLIVTDVLEVMEGRLELPGNPHAGFVTAQTGITPNKNYKKAVNNFAYYNSHLADILVGNDEFYTSSIVRSPLQLYSTSVGSIGYSNCVMWVGYVWNRSGVAQEWTFAFAVKRGLGFFLGEEFVRDFFCNEEELSKPHLRKVTMQPGANLIGIKVFGFADGGGARKASDLKNAEWRDGFGIAFDRQGRDSLNAADYEPLIDPGDGSLVTVSVDGSLPDADLEWNLSFSHLKIAPGAELEAKGCELSLKTVEGMGNVLNGAGYFKGLLSISDLWKISASQIVAGECLAVTDGTIAFGEGCVLEIEDISSGGVRRSEEYVIARATEGIEGLPKLPDSDPNSKFWRMKKVVEPSGAVTLTFKWHKGFVMTVR